MYYFGTDLKNYGHYFWILEPDYMYKGWIALDSLPFNPEDMPYRKRGERFPAGIISKGDAAYYQEGGCSIFAIEGSCKDKRPGSKSVFFMKELISREELKERILSIPIAKRIIEQMPFEVNW
jgi:hypothetical protein